jgi:tRNA threonylcarbamoyladenosine biosynthesis protein TsaB
MIYMPLLLHIDTATEIATLSISESEVVIHSIINENQKEHASFLQAGIKNLLQLCNSTIDQLSAVSVTSGPGSYTGLRVSIASAKGLCYALNIPLILLNTLEVMAASAIATINTNADSMLFCPMIDARRTDVFTAVYDNSLTEILAPCVMKIDESSFSQLLENHVLFFSGSGAEKSSKVIIRASAIYGKIKILPSEIARIAHQKFENKVFSDIALSDALYIKEFYTIS